MIDEPVRINAVHTRLLYPFYFTRRAVAEASQALASARFEGRTVWNVLGTNDVTSEYYTSEFHEATRANLFGAPPVGRYLKVPDDTAHALFGRRLEVRRKGSSAVLPIRFVPGFSAEAFLSPFGVGVLCLTVMLDTDALASEAYGNESANTNHALLLNYRMSQLQEYMQSNLRVPHPQDDAAKWSRIPEAERTKIPHAPKSDVPFAQRINVPGAEYVLDDVVKYLLDPLRGNAEYKSQQMQFSVYTVVRFPQDVDVLAKPAHDSLGRILAGLAQVEEQTHAGAVPGQPTIEQELLNRNHWAGIGCLGAAHLVVDQPGNVAFNEERLQRSRDRYFVAYLTSYMQRLAIKRTSDVVGSAMQATAPGEFDSCAPEFRRVLRDMIEFNSLSYLSEVSSREAINRYYRLARAGLQVPDAWDRVNQNIFSLDAACRTAQNETLARQHAEDTRTSRETLEESKELHAKVEWVEILILAVYAAEMFHIAGEIFHFPHLLVGTFTLGGSLLAMLVAFFLLRPDHHFRIRGLPLAVVGGLLLMAGYLSIGFDRLAHEPHKEESHEAQLLEGILHEVESLRERFDDTNEKMSRQDGHVDPSHTDTDNGDSHAPGSGSGLDEEGPPAPKSNPGDSDGTSATATDAHESRVDPTGRASGSEKRANGAAVE